MRPKTAVLSILSILSSLSAFAGQTRKTLYNKPAQTAVSCDGTDKTLGTYTIAGGAMIPGDTVDIVATARLVTGSATPSTRLWFGGAYAPAATISTTGGLASNAAKLNIQEAVQAWIVAQEGRISTVGSAADTSPSPKENIASDIVTKLILNGASCPSGSTVQLARMSVTDIRKTGADAPPPDFILTSIPVNIAAQPADMGSYVLTIAPLNGFTGTASLTATGWPATTSYSFTPATISGGSGSSTLAFTVPGGATPGTYPIVVTATSGSIVHTTNLTLNLFVASPPDFTISLAPTIPTVIGVNSLTVASGGTASFTAYASSLNSFAGTITMSQSGLPSGAGSVTWTPSTISGGSGTSVLTFTVGSTPGTYTITGTGTSSPLTHNGTSTLIVVTTTVTVPDVVGSTQTSAGRLITAANLVPVVLFYQASTSVLAGTVISQTPLGGSQVVAGSAVGIVISSGAPSGGISAFPGASGGGADSIGGRGGLVIEVTNLNDTGTGSLRACMTASGPRTCIPRVGGLITLASVITVSNPYLTVAGQTAPGSGITLRMADGSTDNCINLYTHDVIIRYLRVRPGRGGIDIRARGGIFALGNAYNVMIDHVSTSWAAYDMLGTWSNNGIQFNTTFSNNIMSEGLAYSPVYHAKAFNSGSDFQANGAQMVNIDLHHNLMMTNENRAPLMRNASTRLINNIVYNNVYGDLMPSCGIAADIIGNKIKRGPDYDSYDRKEVGLEVSGASDCQPGNPSIYISGNLGPHNTSNLVDDNWASMLAVVQEGDYHSDSGPVDRAFQRSSPLATQAHPIQIDSAADLDTILTTAGPNGVGASARLNNDGSWTNNWDDVDLRVLGEYLMDTGGSVPPADENDVGGYPSYSAGTALTDTDHDGAPDAWETAHGRNPLVYDSNTVDPVSGYTWLEDFLDGISTGVAGTVNGFTQSAIVSALAACGSGGTVFFPAGTYTITSTIELPAAPCTLTGVRSRSILNAPPGLYVFHGDGSAADTFNNLVFRGGGLAIDFGDHQTITFNVFNRIQSNYAVFMPNGMDGSIIDSNIMNGYTCVSFCSDNQNFLGTFDAVLNSSITHNWIDGVYEGMALGGSGLSSGNVIAFNTILHPIRMGIESTPGMNSSAISSNYIAQWRTSNVPAAGGCVNAGSPYSCDSFGLSIVNGGTSMTVNSNRIYGEPGTGTGGTVWGAEIVLDSGSFANNVIKNMVWDIWDDGIIPAFRSSVTNNTSCGGDSAVNTARNALWGTGNLYYSSCSAGGVPATEPVPSPPFTP